MFDDSRTICRHHHLSACVITFIGIFLIFTANVEVLISEESAASEATDQESDEDDQDTRTISTTGSPNLDVPKEDLVEEYDAAEAQTSSEVEESNLAGASNNIDPTEPPEQPEPEVEESNPEVEESNLAGASNNIDPTEPPEQPEPEDDSEGGQDTDQMTDGDEGTLTQSSPQNGDGGGGGIHRSTTDGFQIQVPPGQVVEDIENTNSNNQTSEQQTGYSYLARICPLDSALIVSNGGSSNRYQCEEGSTANVNVMRFDDLHQRPEFAALGNNIDSNNIITTSDFLSYYIQFWQRTAGISEVQILNNIDTAVNVIDAQTSQIVATMPAKLIEYTYLYSPQDDSSGSSATMTQGREFTLLVVNGDTGYSLYHEGLASSLPSGAPPVQIDQMFDSFALVTESSSAG